jgi:hypothetical protein
MSKFDEFRDALKAGLGGLVDELTDHKDAVLAASKAFLDDSEEDFKKWTKQVADGDMSTGDLEFLVKGKADLAMVNWHTQIGLTKVALDKFRQSLLDLINDTAAKVFL